MRLMFIAGLNKNLINIKKKKEHNQNLKNHTAAKFNNYIFLIIFYIEENVELHVSEKTVFPATFLLEDLYLQIIFKITVKKTMINTTHLKETHQKTLHASL